MCELISLIGLKTKNGKSSQVILEMQLIFPTGPEQYQEMKTDRYAKMCLIT